MSGDVVVYRAGRRHHRRRRFTHGRTIVGCLVSFSRHAFYFTLKPPFRHRPGADFCHFRTHFPRRPRVDAVSAAPPLAERTELTSCRHYSGLQNTPIFHFPRLL